MTRRRVDGSGVDLSTTVGSIRLPNPVMTASGTAGHGAELGAYGDLAALGAVVVKSLSADPWPGNPAPRVHETAAGMINSVGLQGPGVEAWLTGELPALEATGTRIVASIWGRTVAEYARAAEMLADAPASVVAVEVNASCPNLEDRRKMFAHDPTSCAEVVAAAAACGRPRWAKLSPNVADIAAVARGAHEAGAEAVTLTNTVLGMVIDTDSRRPVLGGGGGGLSGAAIHPVAVRAVYDCHAAVPDLPIVGVGGVTTPADAIEFLLAGASAVQVGTATFRNPSTVFGVSSGIARWCAERGLQCMGDVIGGAHV